MTPVSIRFVIGLLVVLSQSVGLAHIQELPRRGRLDLRSTAARAPVGSTVLDSTPLAQRSA